MSPETYDLAVIGGGLAGTAAARDAAGRGLSVFLCEALDLGEGGSSATGGLVCEPLEHLRPLALGRLKADLAEREILMRSAPHLVQRTRFLIPLGHQRPWARWALRLGLIAIDRLTKPPFVRSRRIDLAGEKAHGLLRRRLRFAYAISDCVANDSRLAVLNAVDAHIRGASIHARVRCIVAERDGVRWRLSLESQVGGAPFAVDARALINATGAAVGSVNDHVVHTGRRLRVRLMKRAFIVVRRRVPGGDAYALPGADGAPIYVTPLAGGLALVGPRSVPYDGDPAAAAVERADVAWLLQAVNRYIETPLAENDVLSGVAAAWAYPENARFSQWTIDVEAPPHLAPLVSIIGATLTTHRRAAEAAVSAVADTIAKAGPAWTAQATLPGGAFPAGGVAAIARSVSAAYPFLSPQHADRFARAYGTRAQEILIGSRAPADLGRCFGSDLTEAEVNYVRRQEWATTAADVLWRRSKLGFRLTAAEAAGLESWMRRNRVAPPGPVLP